MSQVIGISDIASSEGSLSDFSKICLIIGKKRSAIKEHIYSEMLNKYGKIAEGSFDRKLSIMQKLSLINISNKKYALSGYGHIINHFIKSLDDKKLEKTDKALYFIILFNSKPRQQLTTLLETIIHQQGREKKSLMIEFFQTGIALSIWNEKGRLKKNLGYLMQSDIIPSMLNNKFSCMNKWLESINLVEVKRGGYYTNISTKLLSSLKKESRVENIIEDCSSFYYPDSKRFNVKDNYDLLINLVRTGHKLFCISQSGISDITAVAKYVCFTLLQEHIILEENQFFELTKKLKNDGIIRSIMVSRHGEPRNLSL